MHAQLLFLLVQAKWEQCERLENPKQFVVGRSEEAAARQEAFVRKQRDGAHSTTSRDEESEEENTDPVEPEAVEILVSDLGGEVCRVKADRQWLIWDLKLEIEGPSGLHREQQRLLLGSKDLDDYSILKSLPAGQVSLILVECLERYYRRPLFLQELKASWKALQYASASLRADKELVLSAMEQNYHAWDFAAPELKKRDFDLASKALSHNGLLLEQMCMKIRSDANLVSKAVKQNWRSLKFASRRLRADPFIVRAALSQDVRAMDFAEESLSYDRDFARSAVWLQGMALQYLAAELRGDRELVRISCQKHPGAIAHAAPKLFEDLEFMKSLRGNSEAPKFYSWNDEQRHQMEEELFDQYNYVNRAA